MTKITIGIVTFDRINFLKRAVRSVLRQSYKNYIIYIGNDNPKKKINFKDLGLKKNNKIKIFNYKKNIGERKNLNYLLKKSNTDYFCWLGDDDYLHKDFFKILISQFKVNKKLIASYSNYSRAQLKLKQDASKHIHFDQENFLLGFTSKQIRLIGTFGLIKTNYLKKIGGINKTGKSFKDKERITHHYPYCDLLIPIMLSKYGNISWIDKRLVHLNTDQTSVTGKTNEYDVYVSAENYLLSTLKNTIKRRFNSINYDMIFSNMIDWFILNRNMTIKRRSSVENFKNLNIYVNHLFHLSLKKGGAKGAIFFLTNFIRIMRSIL